MPTKFNFEEVNKMLSRYKRETLVLLANQAQNYFLGSFKKQGWNGSQWPEVQRRTPGTKAYKYPKTKGLQRRTQPILIGSGYKKRGGTLRRAVSSMERTAQISSDRVRMLVDLPYAEVINEGGKHMPERRFIGQTEQLTKMQKDKITEIVNKIWQTK
ncbi:MAG TPA: hypothetical protein VN722_08455 [Hanamia sp.]|nr:hypothetical protein [Hanamia sp.]